MNRWRRPFAEDSPLLSAVSASGHTISAGLNSLRVPTCTSGGSPLVRSLPIHASTGTNPTGFPGTSMRSQVMFSGSSPVSSARSCPISTARAIETHLTGVPMMRPMILEFPEDPSVAYLDRQYFFGSGMLVAPVFSEDGKVTYYLPEGTWTHFLTGVQVSGPGWRTETCGYLSLPVMVRENSLIPVGPRYRCAFL